MLETFLGFLDWLSCPERHQFWSAALHQQESWKGWITVCRRNGASGCASSTCWTCWTWKETNASFCEPWPFQFKNPLQPWDISRRFWIWGAPIQQASFMVSILALSGVGSKTATRAEFHQESRLRRWRSGASGVLASSLLGRKPVEAAQRGMVFSSWKSEWGKVWLLPMERIG